jgi:type IV secretion system protein VirB9
MKRLVLLLFLALAAPAFAIDTPTPGITDPRIRFVDYDPDQVVLLTGFFGYQTMLEFAPDERIENVSIGDALGWQVTPNKKANLLFLKPIDRSAATNMTVVTDKRRYAFDLVVAPEKQRQAQLAYVVRFHYPQEGPVTVIDIPAPEVAEVIPAENWNFAYNVSGSKASLPERVFDDGKATYFTWPASSAIPGIFAIGPDGSESLVNYAIRGKYMVVDQLAPRFILRNGKDTASVVNAGYAARSAGR